MRDRQRTWRYAAYCCRRGLCLWLLGLFLLPLLAQAEQFIGKVVGIRTGDTAERVTQRQSSTSAPLRDCVS